jgi:gamma-glutamylcysteine synthetase
MPFSGENPLPSCVPSERDALALFENGFLSDAVPPSPGYRFGAEFEFCLCDLNSPELRAPAPQTLERFLSSLGSDYRPRVDPVSRAIVALVALDGSTIAPDFSRGTLELSTTPCLSLSELDSVYRLHCRHLAAACRPHQLSIIGIGLHPLLSPDSSFIFRSNSRYRTGGLDFLQTTSQAIHVTLGVSAADAVATYRVFTMLSPVMLAMFANSAHANGSFTGISSFRELMWSAAISDETRLGIGPDVRTIAEYFSELSGRVFSRLERGGQTYHIKPRISFRDFLRAGQVRVFTQPEGEANLQSEPGELSSDLATHESTTWFNVRLRHTVSAVEIRAADMLRPGNVLWPAVFCRGISAVLPAVQKSLVRVQWPLLHQVRRDAVFRGLDSDYFGITTLEMARELCAHARDGLLLLGEDDYLPEIDLMEEDMARRGAQPRHPLTREDLLARFRFDPS